MPTMRLPDTEPLKWLTRLGYPKTKMHGVGLIYSYFRQVKQLGSQLSNFWG